MRWVAGGVAMFSTSFFLYCMFKSKFMLTEQGKEKVSAFFLGDFFMDKSCFTPEGWKYRVRGISILWAGVILFVIILALSE